MSERVKEIVNKLENGQLGRKEIYRVFDELIEHIEDLEVKNSKISLGWAKSEQKYREVLEFYADNNTYLRETDENGKSSLWMNRPIENDGGDKARQILKGDNT